MLNRWHKDTEELLASIFSVTQPTVSVTSSKSTNQGAQIPGKTRGISTKGTGSLVTDDRLLDITTALHGARHVVYASENTGY